MIPISQPLIAKNAKKYVNECLQTGWVSSAGSFVEKFEEKFARFVGTRYAVATSSGTSALHLALASLHIEKNDEVIVPTYTMIASVLPLLYIGAKPVFLDSEKATGNMDVSLVEQLITKKTKAIMPVHMFGHPVDMAPITRLAKKYGLAVIEDSAEAHGAQYYSQKDKKWMKVGSIGTIGCFSFYGNKIITTGEGGMLTTNSKKIADRAKSLRNLARTPGQHFLHKEIAFAYRMSNLEAAVGLAELEEIDRYIKRKREIAKKYNKLLADIPAVQLPVEKSYAKSVFWQYGILLQNGTTPSSLARELQKHNIETRRFFVPMHKQPALEAFKTHNRYPVAEKLYQQGLCIPSGVALTDQQQITVVHALKRILA